MFVEDLYRREPKERQHSDGDKSWQVNYDSYDRQYDVDAVNHSVIEPENPTVMRHPVRAAYGGSGAQAPREPIENWSRSHSTSSGTSDGAADGKETITFERPGNTQEFPCFVNAADTAAAPVRQTLDVCLEQSEHSGSASNASSKHLSTDYDYARSDMSILTGTHTSVNTSYNRTSPSYHHASHFTTDPDPHHDDQCNDAEQVPETSAPGVSVDEFHTSDRSDFRASDLDILMSPSPSSGHYSAATTSSRTSDHYTSPLSHDPHSYERGARNKHADKYAAPVMSPGADVLDEPMSKLAITPLSSSVHDTTDVNDAFTHAFNFESPINGDQNPVYTMPADQLPGQAQNNGFDEGFLTPPITSDLVTSSDIFDDSKVMVNDSVSFFVDKSPYTSTTESQPSSTTKPPPPVSADITFNFETGTSSSFCDNPANLQKMMQKADAYFDDVDVESFQYDVDFSYGDGGYVQACDETLLAREERN